MGSLMAGWSSPVKDPKFAIYQRNRSFTKEEIDAFWKSKKKTEEEHLNEIVGHHDDIDKNNQKNMYEALADEPNHRLHRSSSLPLTSTKNSLLNSDSTSQADYTIKLIDGWWTRSNSAFLNEPPVQAMEGPSHKYAAQYHVANLVAQNN